MPFVSICFLEAAVRKLVLLVEAQLVAGGKTSFFFYPIGPITS